MLRHVFTVGLLLAGATPPPAGASTLAAPPPAMPVAAVSTMPALAATFLTVTVPTETDTATGIIEVSGGCGPYGHRGPYGGCRPNYYHHPFCPPGFHRGPSGAHCVPN